MATTTIYAENTDGYVNKTSTSDFTSARDAATGSSYSSSSIANSVSVTAHRYASRGGGNTWQVWRSFFMFDTSSISDATDVKLYLLGAGSYAGDFAVARSTAGSTLSTSDFNEIHGWSGAGSLADESSNVTLLASKVEATSSWNSYPNSHNEIDLNSAALALVNAGSSLDLVCLNWDYDLVGADPGTNTDTRIGLNYADYSGTSRDPYIIVTTPDVRVNAIFFGTNF